jgi:DNA-binding SARP family transcriptional activator
MAGRNGSRVPHPISVQPRLALLNAFSLQIGHRDVVLSLPAQRLLAFLALQDRPVLREHVAETLWLQSNVDHASGSLRSALWKLRQPGCTAVIISRGRLQLAPDVEVDVHEATVWAHRIMQPPTRDAAMDTTGLAYRGDVLPDWYDDWIALERECYRQLRAQALETLCGRLTQAGRYGEAMEAALAAIRAEPLRETAHRALMCVHLEQGNHAEALVQYRRFRHRLDRELGLTPSNRMHDLLGQLHAR